jgi:16S rRNA (cytosine967-C5)-methyltransferase
MMQGTRPHRRTRDKSAREIALIVLYHVDTRKAFADLQLGRALNQGDISGRDAALATEIVGGTLRWRARLDWILSKYVRAGLDSLSPYVLNVLRLSLYQLLFLDRVPSHAVVDEAVKLTKRYAHAGAAGLVNAVLRKMLREGLKDTDPETAIPSRISALAVAYSHPEWLVARWMDRLGDENTVALLKANNRVPSLGVRTNAMRTDREALRQEMEKQGLVVETSPYSTLALRVRADLVPSENESFRSGHCFIQDESETMVGELVGARPGETVLDLCAAPGGKTSHIQESRACVGLLVAVDVQASRLRRVNENLNRLGLTGVGVVQADGVALQLSRPVDRVLVDAPCSGLGVIARRADARWRKTEASLQALLPLQAALLAAGAAQVRPGGVLVYSVCSNEPEEGRGRIDAFLENHPEFGLEDAAGLVSPQTVTDGCLFMTPHEHGTDGVFAARLRRKE